MAKLQSQAEYVCAADTCKVLQVQSSWDHSRLCACGSPKLRCDAFVQQVLAHAIHIDHQIYAARPATQLEKMSSHWDKAVTRCTPDEAPGVGRAQSFASISCNGARAGQSAARRAERDQQTYCWCVKVMQRSRRKGLNAAGQLA